MAECVSRDLLVQSQQWKHQNSIGDLFQVYSKDWNDVNDIILVSFL